MTSAPMVSICLPTCDRPELIVECLDSCLAQTYPHIEILIGDDSRDDLTQQLIAARYAHDARIRYVRNEPPLGQARNVASLFERASGALFMLIHDDDYLVLEGVARLAALWQRYPHLEVAFGDQYEVDASGRVDVRRSAALNAAFHRKRRAQGMQASPGRTGLVQMFPNNGWLALAALVRRVGYHEDAGACCDFVFGVELCLAASHVHYLHEYVSYYRRTPVSISRSTRVSPFAAAFTAYSFVLGLSLDASLEAARRTALRRLAPIVVSLHARHDAPLAALRVALDRPDAYAYGLSPRFYYHLALIARALLAVFVRQRPRAPRFP
ncbi:glycosyltransferase family 2 protein [Caballeronia ptereochthonis]|jgi:glycosyltransferase involved in cell wall biosynthesis|uniref:Glycosyl transferase family 2 n=1 Tax=Caballeronia ptereochthonis TaxID=1777144 RepID=A0A158B7B5_9BURK|nr:glycosyltransferase family 2 protein [Caballeronia ptereochthonis]SAK65889.1 glycosyl transferase family 2 [Caballeronia ptereochthonis]